MATFVSDPTDLKAVNDGRNKMVADGIAAVQAKDEAGAVRALVDGVEALPGSFEIIYRTEGRRPRKRADAAAPYFAAPPPPSITGAQLGAIKAPTAVVRGE